MDADRLYWLVFWDETHIRHVCTDNNRRNSRPNRKMALHGRCPGMAGGCVGIVNSVDGGI